MNVETTLCASWDFAQFIKPLESYQIRAFFALPVWFFQIQRQILKIARLENKESVWKTYNWWFGFLKPGLLLAFRFQIGKIFKSRILITYH